MKKCILFLLFPLLQFALGSCEFDEPGFSDFGNFKLLKLDGNKLNVSFDVKVNNSNGFGMKVKRGNLDVKINGTPMGTVLLSEKIKMKRKSDKLYTIPLQIQLLDGALFKLMKLATSGKAEVQLDGKVRGSVFGIGKTIEVHETKTVDGSQFKIPGKN